jgi:uncharacterized protein (TIGR03067 family)
MATVKAAALFASGGQATTARSAQVVALAERIISTMWFMKLKHLLVLCLVVGVLGGGASLLAQVRNGPSGEPELKAPGKPKGETSILAAAQKADAVETTRNDKADRSSLRGEWVFDSAISGQALDGRQQDLLHRFWNARVTFTKQELRLSNVQVPTQQGNPTPTPHTLDLEMRDKLSLSAFPSGKLKGIYELDGDTLKLCLPAKEGQDRPLDFKATPGSNLNLFILKRLPARQHETGGRTAGHDLTVRALDPAGKPVLLAKVGTRADFNILGLGPEWTYWHQALTGEDGVAVFPGASADGWLRDDGWLIARHYGRNLVAIEKITPTAFCAVRLR